MRVFSVLLLLLLACSACQKDSGEVYIRVINNSDYTFTNIVVADQQFGDLPAQSSSDYQLFDRAYHYAYINVRVEGQEYILQPIDFVGEEPLRSGYYSYKLDIEQLGDQYGSLLLTFVDEN